MFSFIQVYKVDVKGWPVLNTADQIKKKKKTLFKSGPTETGSVFSWSLHMQQLWGVSIHSKQKQTVNHSIYPKDADFHWRQG